MSLIRLLVAPIHRVLGDPTPSPAVVAATTRIVLWVLLAIGVVTATLAGRAALTGTADSNDSIRS